MEAEIYSWIRNIVIFMMINTIIMNLLGNKSYKKYVSIASGLILVLIVISPLVKLLNLQGNLDYFLESHSFAMDTSDFKNQLNQVQADQSEKITTEYKEQIKGQIKEILAKDKLNLEDCNIGLDMDSESKTYGQIQKISLKATTEESREANGGTLIIDEVRIDPIHLGEEEEKDSRELPSPLEISIKNKLSDFYNIEQGNINISIQGG